MEPFSSSSLEDITACTNNNRTIEIFRKWKEKLNLVSSGKREQTRDWKTTLQKVNSGELKGGTILLARQLTYRVSWIKTRNESWSCTKWDVFFVPSVSNVGRHKKPIYSIAWLHSAATILQIFEQARWLPLLGAQHCELVVELNPSQRMDIFIEILQTNQTLT